MKKKFIHDDFLLESKPARTLYHDYAEEMPIIDYHCHLPPRQIAELLQQRYGETATAPIRAWLLRLEAQRYARSEGSDTRRTLAQLRRELRQLSWSFT